MLQAPEQRFCCPCCPREDYETGCPCAGCPPKDVHSGAGIQLQLLEDPMLKQVDQPEGCCNPVESPCRSRVLSGPVALKQSAPEGVPQRIQAGADCEELQPLRRTHVGEVHGVLSPVRGTTHWNRRLRIHLAEEEKAAEM